MSRSTALLLVVLAAPIFGCEGATPRDEQDTSSDSGACGMTSCTDQLLVSLVAEGQVLAGGAYAIGWSNDGVDDDCSFVIEGDAAACGGDPPCASANDCDADFGFSSAPQFVVLEIMAAPEMFEITVLRDGDVVLETGFSPQYEDFYPNGSECPPVCAQSAAELALP